MRLAIPYWPPDIQFQAYGIYDRTLNVVTRLNPTGSFIAARINGHASSADIANALEIAYGLDSDTAKAETIRFLGQLNSKALINFRHEHSDGSPAFEGARHLVWNLLDLTSRLTKIGPVLPGGEVIWHRTTLRLHSPFKALVQMISLVSRKMWIPWSVLVLGGLPAIFIGLFLANAGAWLNMARVYGLALLAATFGIITSIATHELGHGWMWQFMTQAKELVVITHGYDLRVICPTRSIHEQQLVALAGPLANCLAFILGIALIVLLTKGNFDIQLMISAFFAPQLLMALSVFFYDGTVIWRR